MGCFFRLFMGCLWVVFGLFMVVHGLFMGCFWVVHGLFKNCCKQPYGPLEKIGSETKSLVNRWRCLFRVDLDVGYVGA